MPMNCTTCFIPMKRGTAKKSEVTLPRLNPEVYVPGSMFVPVLKCHSCRRTVEIEVNAENPPASAAKSYYRC